MNYSGSLSATVRLYAAVTGTLAPYVRLIVVRGSDPTPTFDSCATFTPDATNYYGLGAGVLYDGTLGAYPATYNAGVVDPLAAWANGQTLSYRMTVEILDDNAAQGLTAGATFTWEARS